MGNFFFSCEVTFCSSLTMFILLSLLTSNGLLLVTGLEETAAMEADPMVEVREAMEEARAAMEEARVDMEVGRVEVTEATRR